MSIVRLEAVVREVGTFVILDQATATVAAGDRIGLVGPNGAGKTTLLRLVAGLDEPDRGSVRRRRGLSLGLLAQEAHLDEAFMSAPDLRTAVRRGAREVEALEASLGRLEADGRAGEPEYAELRTRFEALDGYTLDVRVDEALSGLGFSREEWRRPPRVLSGGEQTRAALARLVIADPDLLLLDEPTNHLDLDALEWLEEHLRRRERAVVVASHDRAFLDATVTRIWELRDRRLTVFRGDYAAYHRQRVERDARAAKDAELHAAAVAREEALIRRYRSHRKFTKMHEHETRLERLREQPIEAPRRRSRLTLPTDALRGEGPARSGGIVVRAADLVVGYLRPAPGEPVRVARAPFLAAQRGERIGIVGPNGAGKTTLLRTIAGELPPVDGALAFGNAVQIGYLSQLRGAAIPGATVLDAILEALPIAPAEARSYLARFLFRGDDVFREVRLLSGGERSRLELALLGILPSNLLLLDEPTNHLDIPAREAIETFLRETPATVLVVSHDRRLLERLADRLWVVDDGLAVPFDGSYREWRAAVADGWTPRAAAERESARLRTSTPASSSGAGPIRAPDPADRTARTAKADPTAPAGSPARRGPAKARSRLSKDAFRRRSEAVEAELVRLGVRKSQLELAIATPAVASNFVELRRVTSELADVTRALAEAEDAWLELQEAAP